MGVRVVTDSSAGLPSELLEGLDVAVVPLTVTAGGRSGPEGSEVTSEDVLAALSNRLEVRTARPAPAAFEAAAVGADELVAIHLSGELSGTVDAAQAALGDRGPVLDARTCGMGLGHVVLAAARSAADGGSVEAVVAAAETAMAATAVWFSVDTLDALRRGGRIGAAQALLGTALSVKPILAVQGGAVVPVEKVRTGSRALARLQALAVEAGAREVSVMHLAAAHRAAQLAAGLRTALPADAVVRVTELSVAVGAHTGAGAVGVAVTGTTGAGGQPPSDGSSSSTSTP